MKTVRDLSLPAVLALGEQAQTVAAEFAARAQALERTFQARRAVLQRQGSQTAQGEARAGRRQALEATLEARAAQAEAFFAARAARTERLGTRALSQVPGQARTAAESRLGGLQWQLRQAENARAAGLQAEAEVCARYGEQLAEEGEKLRRERRRVRAALRAYLPDRRHLAAPEGETHAPARDLDSALATLRDSLAALAALWSSAPRFGVARLFRAFPLTGWLLLWLAAAAALVWSVPAAPPGRLLLAAGAGGSLAVVLGLYGLGWRQSRPAARALLALTRQATHAHHEARLALEAHHLRESTHLEEAWQTTRADLMAEWERNPDFQQTWARTRREKLTAQLERLRSRQARQAARRLEALAGSHARQLAELEAGEQQQEAELTRYLADETARLQEDEAAREQELSAAWQAAATPLAEALRTRQEAAAAEAPAWSEAAVDAWEPASTFPETLPLATAELTAFPDVLPRHPRLPWPGPLPLTLPVALTFPHLGSLRVETRGPASPPVRALFQNAMLRLLARTPPGRIAFTIFDPLGLGENFSGLMHLADYEESVINRRIWTQTAQLESCLGELNEHLEKVIQMYLRQEYADISAYNAQAGTTAEKYHFLVVADFPTGFSELAVHRLQSLMASGPRCGVFTLLHWDRRRPAPEGLTAAELRQGSLVLSTEGGALRLEPPPDALPLQLTPEPPVPAPLAARLLHRIGQSSLEAGRVEVPFRQIAPPADALWQLETSQELRVPIGRSGATRLQYLALGRGTKQHALFAGRTGSGKSTLFHVLITNLALWCSPEQVEFYLIDFKKGVEFKRYAERRLPHARVIAIESDRQFALSVLQRVDEELRRRGDLFRHLGVQDLPGYHRARLAAGAPSLPPMPRTLLIIDEFQEFFTEDDPIAQNASLLFDRLVRQGRAFGLHVLLGSQTLGGAYTLARATLGQMNIRVALQCNEADAYLIMDENNPAPRLLSRPGEGIYNDAAGAPEGNSPFQVVWLPDEERDAWLRLVREHAARGEQQYPAPIVFEGNAPAEGRENELLQRLFTTASPLPLPPPRCWLGAPNSIKGPTEAVFLRQSGNNLLIVGQQEEAAASLLGLALLTLLAQHPAGQARFVFLQGAAPGSAEAALVEQIAEALPGAVQVVSPGEIAPVLAAISAELKQRLAGEDGAAEALPWFIFGQSLQRFKKLRAEEEFSMSFGEEEAASPARQFGELMTEGAAHGLHLLASVDAFNSVSRFINRRALSEWEMRVAFQMSASDSASLLDSPAASALGLHRAVFYSERTGTAETFRPYARPEQGWVQSALEKLVERYGAAPSPSVVAARSPIRR